jgi:hypothetical protein
MQVATVLLARIATATANEADAWNEIERIAGNEKEQSHVEQGT